MNKSNANISAVIPRNILIDKPEDKDLKSFNN